MRRGPTRGFLAQMRRSELGGLAGDSVYVGIWQGAISVADLGQIVLVAHVLGLHDLGRLAVATGFVVLVGQFFDVRVGAAATTFGARRLAHGDLRGAAGLFQLSYLTDAATGVLGFAVVAALSPLAGPHLIGTGGTALLLLYGLTLLVSTVDGSSLSILRLFGRFRLIAGYTLGLEALRIGFVVIALVFSPSLTSVLIALVAHDLVGAAVNAVAASRVYRAGAGESLCRPRLGAFSEKRAMLRMVIHTNVVSYARLVQGQLPPLLIGALGGATQVGVYKVGTGAASAVGRLSDPAYAALLPRLSRLWATGRRADLRRLVARATLVSAPTMAVAFLVLVLLRHPILAAIGGPGAAAGAGTVLVLAGAAQAVNGALFWNVSVLFAAERSSSVSRIAIAGAGLHVAVLVPLVALLGAEGAAAALLTSLVATNLAATWLGLIVLGAPGAAGARSPAPGAQSAEPRGAFS